MKVSLYIIVDISSSMSEMGKIHLQRNLCRYAVQLLSIDQGKYADIDLRFYQWAQNISEISVQSDRDIPALKTEGSTSINVLSDFISQSINDTERQMFLILSDGNIANSDILNYQNQLKLFPDLIIRTVAVGADADLLKLKKLSTNNSVHLSENISSAIDSTIFGAEEDVAAPESTTQILRAKPTEPVEDWDA
ncbi:hypothetical protein OR1_02748 [Geobacter sp. OR-1]|uniref:VWA domain-containing protein n=1 Tax=Geobacter sp. OR-1 TaxID=1266765 RepID=UPI0005432E4E|nr:VWA domain-containing protein [Geobacter sp. OR-1]GAM10459.1 hypothetical protein OR1_02748 [Geobacter sp. OR-1]